MEPLFEKLQKDFGLNSKHILILEAVKEKDLDARQICSVTQIPQGMIYNYLNYLIENKLIERTSKKPFKYSISNLNSNVIGFMKNRIDNMVKAQLDIMDTMKGPGLDYFERITDSKKFTMVHLNMLMEAKTFNYISLHTSFPYIMYPLDYKSFITLRKAIVKSRQTITYFDAEIALLIYKTYKDGLEQGKQINVVFEESALKFHAEVIKKSLGKKFFDDWKQQILNQFEKYNITAYVSDQHLPFQIDVNERRVNVSLRHRGIINGIVIQGRDITSFYNEVFEQNCKVAKNVVPILKKL